MGWQSTKDVSPVPSPNVMWKSISSLPGSVMWIEYAIPPVTPSSPASWIVTSAEGATLYTMTWAVAVEVNSPSRTSTTGSAPKSSPHVWVTTASGPQSMSQVPSPSKSQRYWSASPSGSVEALAFRTTGVPSGTVAGAERIAFGGLFVVVVSVADPWRAHSVVEDAVTVARSVAPEGRAGIWSSRRIGSSCPGAIGLVCVISGSPGASTPLLFESG